MFSVKSQLLYFRLQVSILNSNIEQLFKNILCCFVLLLQLQNWHDLSFNVLNAHEGRQEDSEVKINNDLF